LRRQGAALMEALTLSADNAIKSNSLFDLLIQEKFADLVAFLGTYPDYDLSPDQLADFAVGYGVDAILIFNDQGALHAAGVRGAFIDKEDLLNVLEPVVSGLLADTIRATEFRIIAGELPGDVSMYYLEETNDGRFVVAIVSDALFYSEAKKNIGIGYLVQNIAREVGIEYIIFQTREGIVFSSRKIGPMLKIEKDPLLQQALMSDTVLSRQYSFDGRPVFELVRSFSSLEYGQGVFRLALSLEKYNEIVAGYDRQMIVLSVVLFAAIILTVMYLVGKQKRLYLDRSYRRMKSLSELVFDSINSGLVAIGRGGQVEMANRRFLDMFDIEEAGLVGRRWSEFPFRDIIPFERFLEESQAASEYKTAWNSGRGYRDLLVNIARRFDHENRAAGAVAVIYDYTHIRELESAARRKERLSELGDMAAGVAHEIRNPLNAISIAAQRLMAEFRPVENSEEFDSFARQIKYEAGRLNEIVNRFLSLARGKKESRDRINLSRITEETLSLLRLDAEKADVRLSTNIEPDIYAPGTEDRYRQLIINVVRNAIEAVGKNEGKVDFDLTQTADLAVLRITDNGPGISGDIVEKIFTPYFSTKEKGTGLGLSIAHQIVEEFGGHIKVGSSDSGGAQFEITLPK
jgi:two-component system sensor histidine kinase HydH